MSVAVCCSVLQCVAVCCRISLINTRVVINAPLSFAVTRCVVCCSVLLSMAVCCNVLQDVTVCCSVLLSLALAWQCIAVCCSVLQCVAVWCSRIQCVAVCCSGFLRQWISLLSLLRTVLQCIAMCCRVLQCVAGFSDSVLSKMVIFPRTREGKRAVATNLYGGWPLGDVNVQMSTKLCMAGKLQINWSFLVDCAIKTAPLSVHVHEEKDIERKTWLRHIWDVTLSYMGKYLLHTCELPAIHHTPWCMADTLQHTATHCNTLQHTATHIGAPYIIHHMASKTEERQCARSSGTNVLCITTETRQLSLAVPTSLKRTSTRPSL